MGKEDRERKRLARREHNRAVQDFYRQNGYIAKPEPALDNGTPLLGERPTAPLTDEQREAIEFGAELAATRGVWEPAARLRNQKEAEERQRWREENSRNEAANRRDNPPPKGISMSSHNEATIGALAEARSLVEQARGALATVEQRTGDITAAVMHADQKVTEAAGHTATAMGTTTHISGRLANFGTGRDDIVKAVGLVNEQVRLSIEELSLLVALYDEAIVHFQAQSQ
jgi:hypothetical protein